MREKQGSTFTNDRYSTKGRFQFRLFVLLLMGCLSTAHADVSSDYQALIEGTSGLQNYWNFEDSASSGSFTSVTDVKGGANGTVKGSVETATGLVGQAGYFPGDSDSDNHNNVVIIDGSDSDTQFDLQESFTIEALVYVEEGQLPSDKWTGIFTKGDGAWRLARQSNGSGIQGATSGAVGGTNNNYMSLDNNHWHYVALRYDQTTGIQTVFFDRSSATGTTTAGTSVNTTDYRVFIGGNDQKTEREWCGYIDEVAIYTVALSDEAIKARLDLLDSGDAIDTLDGIAYWADQNGEGDFGSDQGWDDTAPVADDMVVIGNAGSVTFDGNEYDSNSLVINSLEVGSTTNLGGNGSSGEGTLEIHSGTLTVSGGSDLTIGLGLYGDVNQTGGTLLYDDGDDLELGEDPDGYGVYRMTGGLVQIGYWVEDDRFDNGFYITNNDSGDDLSIGRERSTSIARGELYMSNDAEFRVANDMFAPDAGEGDVYMDNDAVLRVGDDIRAGSADGGTGIWDVNGFARVIVEDTFAIGDSTDSDVEITARGHASIEVGDFLNVSGRDDDHEEAGLGILNIEDAATVNVGSILYQGDIDGNRDVNSLDIPDPWDLSEDYQIQLCMWQVMNVGGGPGDEGEGTVNQTGAESLVTVGRELNVGYTNVGTYNLEAGTLLIRGDAPLYEDLPSTFKGSDASGSGGMGIELSLFTDLGGDLILGTESGSDGLLNVTGGALQVTRDFSVGTDGTGTLRVQDANQPTLSVGGFMYFGGSYSGNGNGKGTLVAVLSTDADFPTIEINDTCADGGGDLYIYDGVVDVELAETYRPTSGDYSSDPLEWKLINFEGERDGEFTLADGLEDGTANGIEWALRYDSKGAVYLQALKVNDLN